MPWWSYHHRHRSGSPALSVEVGPATAKTTRWKMIKPTKQLLLSAADSAHIIAISPVTVGDAAVVEIYEPRLFRI